MGMKLQRFWLFAGLVLYLFDFGSDIYVAVQYWNNNEVWWFLMTVIFISIPSIVVNMTAIIQQLPLIKYWRRIMAVLQLSIVVRYIEEIMSPAQSHVLLLPRLRYLETIMESAPQWCLQVYIMFSQSKFPWYTIFSSVLSLVSLAWSITALEQERAISKRRDFMFSAKASFLTWQLFTLISRVSAIVIITYVFRYYALIFLAIHWLLLTVAMLIIQRIDEAHGLGKALFLSWLLANTSLFHISKTDLLPTTNPNVEMTTGFILMLVENAIMVTLSLTIGIPALSHKDVLEPLAMSCLIGGSILSLIGFIFYYCFVDRDL